jgi:hypothetical protein
MEELTRDAFKQWGQKGGRRSSSHRWRSLIDPTVVSTAAGIEKYHLKRGWDVKARERVLSIETN